VLLLAVTGPILYSFLFPKRPKQPPIYETYTSGRLEGAVKALDKGISDALVALEIPARDVDFSQVKTIQTKTDHWTYSELTVKTRTPLPMGRKQEVFSDHIQSITPQPRLRFQVKSNGQSLVDISMGGHLTHRILFIPHTQKPTPEPVPAKRPRIALIIDDMGYDLAIARQLLRIDAGLSISVLPHSPFQKEIASLAHQAGRDVLLHLPMEPLEYPEIDPGPGALITSMTPDEMLEVLRHDLDAVPYISGVNNHMGSRLTEDAARMRQVFTILKKRGLFFVDSLTSPRSKCAQVAHLFKLPFAQRHVFLDHTQEANAIRFQIKRLISTARKHGKPPLEIALPARSSPVSTVRMEFF